MCKIAYKSCHRTEQDDRIPRLYYMTRMPTTMTITQMHDLHFYCDCWKKYLSLSPIRIVECWLMSL